MNELFQDFTKNLSIHPDANPKLSKFQGSRSASNKCGMGISLPNGAVIFGGEIDRPLGLSPARRLPV